MGRLYPILARQGKSQISKTQGELTLKKPGMMSGFFYSVVIILFATAAG